MVRVVGKPYCAAFAIHTVTRTRHLSSTSAQSHHRRPPCLPTDPEVELLTAPVSVDPTSLTRETISMMTPARGRDRDRDRLTVDDEVLHMVNLEGETHG